MANIKTQNILAMLIIKTPWFPSRLPDSFEEKNCKTKNDKEQLIDLLRRDLTGCKRQILFYTALNFSP